MRLGIWVSLCLITAGTTAALTQVDGLAPFVGLAEAKTATSSPPKLAPPAHATVSPQVLYLIRATLGALQDANTTGNYSVLRDLAAPSFQAKHTAADLADIFATARRKPIDLAAAQLRDPIVTETARPDPAQMHLVGYIPGERERIQFQLQFEAVQGHWRLAGVALSSAK